VIWNFFSQSARLVNRRIPSSGVSSRPKLETLEDRTVPTVIVFSEIQSQSPLVLSGNINGANIQPQGVNALTSTNYGTFVANVDFNNGIIDFLGQGNDFCSDNSGRWAPMPDGSSGTATAIYGLQADLGSPFMAAIRDFHTRADNPGFDIPMYQNADGTWGFPSWQTITINACTGTWANPDMGHGAIPLAGVHNYNQANDGSIVDNGNGTLTLTVPIHAAFDTYIAGLGTELWLDGQIVGIGSYGNAPRPPQTPHDPALGGTVAALAQGTNQGSSVGIQSYGLPPGSLQGIPPGTLVIPLDAQSHVWSDPAGQTVHHYSSTSSDQLTAQDGVFQTLP
jgi:hypothetical protein